MFAAKTDRDGQWAYYTLIYRIVHILFRSMAEILSERESISKVMQDALDEATDPWGVKAERVEM